MKEYRGKFIMDILSITQDNRQQINDFIRCRWYSKDIVVRGELVNMTLMEGFVIYEEDSIIGLVTFRIKNQEMEIMSLDSLRENQGIGTALINKVIELAKQRTCTRIKLITTNDNINALRFYQKRGFDMVYIYHNALDISRQLKPSIPLLGEYDIPLKHEIEFELNF